MRGVWKFRLMDERGFQVGQVAMPADATPLHIGMQDGWLCLWAEVEAGNPLVDREFVVVGTGHPIPASASYVGTTQDGSFVWHLYESSVPGELPPSAGTDPSSARGVEPVRPTSAPLAGPSSTTDGVPPTSSVVGSAPPVTDPTSAPTASGTEVGE